MNVQTRQFGGGYIAPSVLNHMRSVKANNQQERQMGGGYIAPSILAHLRKASR